MSKLDTNFVKQLYSSKGVELTPEKLQYISENYTSNEELESSFNMKYSDPQEPKTDPKKKTQNSTTTSTKTPSVSPTQQSQRKPTSVGGKPLQTGVSVSSAGKGKPTQEYELKPIKDERGREVYEKDASGKLVPKMEKVLKGYASSTEEREIVREEVKQKALKPLSNSVTLQSYKESTKPTEQEINDAVTEIDDKINQKGFGNGVSTGLKKGANFLSDIFTTIRTFGTETKGPNFDLNPYVKEEEQAKKELTKEFKGDTSKFSSEDILARTKQIALGKKIEDIQISKNNDFLSNLSEKDKRDLELEKIANYKTISAKDKYLTTEATILVNDAEKDARDYNVVKSIVLNNNKKGIETSKELINYGLQLENNLKEAQLKAEDLENSISTNRAEIGSIEEEIDFIKRNYSLKDKFITNMKLGFGDLYLNIGDRQELMMGDLFGTIEEDRKREIVDKLIDWEEAKGVYRGDLSKDVSFENLKLSNAGEFFFQELGTQVPTFVQIAMPGGVTSSGLTSSFDKYSQMVLEESKDPKVAYSKLQKLTTAIGFGTSEALLGALPTKGILSRSFKSFENAGKRSLFFESGKNYIKRKGVDVIESASMESVTEGLTQVVQNVLDKTVLGKKDVGILDNVGHASFSGGMLGGAMTVVPTIAGVISRPFSDNKQRAEVSNNLKSIFNLQEQLDNQSMDDVSKKVIKDKISELEGKNDDIFKSLAKKTKDMPEDIFNAIVDVVKQQELLSSKATSINSDPNIDVDLKEQLIKDLKGKFDALEAKRSLLISDDVTSFDALSDEEQTKLKEKAANILKKEELDNGAEESKINISEKEINKKAKELYNQKIQEDAKRKQTDGEITNKEKPTTTTEEQAVSTAQQVDAGVQTQEEVTDYKEISKRILDKKELNTIRASLRASSPDSLVLEVLDAISKGNVLGYDSDLDLAIEDMIENGVSINNIANLILEDDVIAEKKGINSKRKAIDYALNIGAKGTILKAGQQAVLNQPKTQEDAKRKQTDGEITSEEKSTTATETKTADTTQQKTELQSQEEVVTPIEVYEGEEIIGTKKDSKGNTYTYVSNTKEKDGVKTTTFSFNRSDKPSSQRNKTSIDSDKVLDKYKYEITEDQIPDGAKVVSIKEIREGKDSAAATVFFETEVDGIKQKFEGEVTLTPKTEINAVQEQTTSEIPVQSETAVSEEVEQGKPESKPEESTEQGEEKVKLQEEVKKASDRLSKAYDAYKNIGIVFDPEGNWKKDKELVSSLVDFAVSNIKFGAYNAKVLIEDLAKKGIEISKDNAKYIFDKANKKFKSDINKTVGIKPKATEQKRINKAYDIGVAFQKLKTVAEKDKAALIKSLKAEANAFIKASITDLKAGDIGNRAITSIASKIQSITDKNFEEKLLEINTVLDNLYTNRDVNTAKDDSKKAFDNVMSGKVGKLDKRGDRDKVMSSKIVNFTKLEPKRLKRILDDADFEQYKDYISRLSGRGLTLSETDLKTIGELYDKISKPYSDYVAEVNRIQQIIDAGGTLTKGESDFVENNSSEFSERETPQTLADKEAKKLESDAKKEAEIAKKKASVKELLPSIKSVFESSNAVKGSLEWRILDALIGLSESDVDSMPDNMLTNALNAISSMVYDDVIPAYAEDLYKYKLKIDYKNALVETLKKAGKAGVYKLKVAKIPLKLREIIGLPIMDLWNGIKGKNITQKIIDRRVKFFNLSSIDAAVKVYGDTPLFNAFMSSFGKAMSRIASAEEKVEAVLLKAKRDLDKNSKNPQESYMKIVYHLIDTMAKNNVGTTSSRSAMEYFEATVSDPNSKISEDNYMKGLVNGFIDKVKGNDNQIDDLTPEEANAANAIRMVLEENQINAYEANLFQNSNAAPMIVEYYPVFNSVVKQAENDLARLKSKFGIDSVSIKAGSLEEKTGTAHPIDLNPFTSAFSSVRNVLFQHQLRSEYAAITQAIKEAIAENSTDNDVLPYLKGIQKALDSQFDLLINGAIHTEPTLTDKILNGTDRAFYTLALGSIISRGVDFAGNMVQLMTINPKYISYSNKVSNALINIKEEGESETELIRSFYENAEASDVNKMISSKKINTERTEFINRGINKEVLSKGLPSSNAGAKIKSKITGPIRDTASGAVDTLLGFGDVKPYAISWNGVFYEEFLKQAGEEVDIEKIARGDVEYLKKYKDAIRKASNKANQENADLYGSTNPMEKKVGIMEIASKKVKNSVPGAVNALVNKAAYLFASFDMNARNDMNTAVNTYIENQEGRNARRFLGGAIRLASYSLAIKYITGALWGLLKGDDDDEEKLKVSFDKLSSDDDFIKEVNNSLLDYPIQKDADGNIIEITGEDLIKYNQMRDKLMQNKDFAAAYDIVYGYVNRDLFDLEVMNKVGEINQGKYEYDKSSVEVFFSDMDNGFGKSDNEIIGVLGLLNSQQGYKLFTEEEIDSYILKLEKYMSETNFLSNRAIRESSGQIDRLIVTKTASILSDYRSNKSAEEVTTTEGLKLFMGMMFSRSNNFTKAAYNFTAELANKQMVQSRRGDRGYDAFKDNVFQTPIKAGLTEVAIKKQLTKDIFNILFPAINKMDRYSTTDHSIPDLVRFTPLGILGANDFAKIDSEMRNDVIYQNTNGKYKENIIKDIKETKIDILRDEDKVKKDSADSKFKKSRVIPAINQTKLKSKFPSYKYGKDLKVNGNKAN